MHDGVVESPAFQETQIYHWVYSELILFSGAQSLETVQWYTGGRTCMQVCILSCFLACYALSVIMDELWFLPIALIQTFSFIHTHMH